MPTLYIALVAIFLGSVIGNLTPRLWPDNPLALTIACIVALFIQGLVALRLRGSAPAAMAATTSAGTVTRSPGAAAPRRAESADRPAGTSSRTNAPDGAATEEGKVKWFNRSKSYGFIVRPNGEEIFVHQRSIRRSAHSGDDRQRPVLRDGQMVRYTLGNSEKGLQAENVQPLD